MMRPASENESYLFLRALDNLLSRSELLSWRYDPASQEIYFSDAHQDLYCDTPQASCLLPVLFSHTDSLSREAFIAAFPKQGLPQKNTLLGCCELALPEFGSAPLSFQGELKLLDQKNIYLGILLGRQYASPSTYPSHYAHHLIKLLDESLIPSLLSDAEGNIKALNKAAVNLFRMQSVHVKNLLSGSFNLIEDAHRSSCSRRIRAIEMTFKEGRSSRFEVRMPLSLVHSHPDFEGIELNLVVTLLPVLGKNGQVARVLVQLQDVTREISTRKALQYRERGYRAFIENSSEGIWCYELNPPIHCGEDIAQQKKLIAQRARLVEANGVVLKSLGVAHCDDLDSVVLNENVSRTYLVDIDKFIQSGYQLSDHEITQMGPHDKEYTFQISCTGIIDENMLTHVWGSTRNVTLRKRYEKKLQHQALHDALTGMPNRQHLYNKIDAVLHNQKSTDYSALLLVDLDRFKDINDTLGHHVGDRLLKMIGPRLAQELQGEQFILARLGGDEFAVFLPKVRSVQQSMVYAHRILDCLALEFDLDVFSTQISASVGVALAPLHSEDTASLLRQAEVAMYHAKEKMLGVSIYSIENDPHSQERLAIISELGRAIRENQLDLYFQPKINLAEGRCYGFEALIRWQHPTLGFISPDKFIPLAEITSFIHPLTHWVLDKSLKQCQQWHQLGYSLIVSVNLSVRNLLDERLPKSIEGLLKKYEIPASLLHIEITESMMMSDPNRALRILQQLNDLGIHLAIDDFGTGYSSLAYLKRLPVKTLKIDRSFVMNMLEDKHNQVIVHSTVNLAHNLGLRVVAEGVESDEIMQSLQMIGCDAAQGYFIAKPMPATVTLEWLAHCPWLERA